MKKKFIAAILTAALALGTLTACGGSDDSAAPAQSDAAESEESTEEPAADEAEPAEETAPEEEPAADAEAEAETEAPAESKGTITVAASATPHAEILEQAKPLLAEQGWDLEVTVFNDYVQPNQVVESGEFDANYFQHIPYLDSFNEEQGTHLVNAGGIHNGILTLKDGVGLEATVRDIVDNPNEIEIQELEAAQVPRVKDEVAFVVLNGNYALEAGFSVAKDAVAYEQADSEAAKTYVNVIAVKEGNENNEAVKALVDVLKSDEITEYINSTYDGGVIPFQ